MKKIFTMNPLIITTKLNIFKYVAIMLQPNSKFILLALFISYFFPIIDKSSLNLFNLLGYFFIFFSSRFYKSNSN